MATTSHPFMGKVLVGKPVSVGHGRERYLDVLMADESVDMEFEGLRDGMIFTDRRIIVWNRQGIMGKKVELSCFPWRAITAFSVENAGTLDLDAELKFCGSGWGVCEVQMMRPVDVREVCRYINTKLFT